MIISIENCYGKLKNYMEKGYECIVVDASFRNYHKECKREYTKNNDKKDFFKDNAVRMVTLGTLIFSSDFVKKLIEDYPINDENYSLWQMATPFHYYSKNDIKAVTYIGNVFYYNNIGTLNSFWNKAGKAFKQWVERWYHIIYSMPNIYDEIKSEIMKIEMFDFHPFYLNSLIRMRANGGFDIKLLNEYKDYLPKVSDTSMKKFYIAALMPRCLAKLIINHENNRCIKKIKSIYWTFNKIITANEDI